MHFQKTIEMYQQALALSLPTLPTCLNVAVWYSGVLKAPYMSNEFSKLVRIVATLGSFVSRATLQQTKSSVTDPRSTETRQRYGFRLPKTGVGGHFRTSETHQNQRRRWPPCYPGIPRRRSCPDRSRQWPQERPPPAGSLPCGGRSRGGGRGGGASGRRQRRGSSKGESWR
jgi:hypothetical protein